MRVCVIASSETGDIRIGGGTTRTVSKESCFVGDVRHRRNVHATPRFNLKIPTVTKDNQRLRSSVARPGPTKLRASRIMWAGVVPTMQSREPNDGGSGTPVPALARVNHFVFECECRNRLWLPVDAVKFLMPIPEFVGFVCSLCTTWRRYSLGEAPKAFGPLAEYQILAPVLCDERRCRLPLLLFVLGHELPSTEERNKWKWDKLVCPGGHPIRKPDRLGPP